MDLKEYGERLETSGFKVLAGSQNTLWVNHGRFAMHRQPLFAFHVPSEDEMREIFDRSHAPLLSFVVEPYVDWPANSSFYSCTDNEYSLDRIPKSGRSQIRRGLSEFDIRLLDRTELVRLGAAAYCDTLARTRQSGGTPQKFRAMFDQYRPDRRYLGAIKGDRLAAFLLVTEVDDWISIGGFSANEFLRLCPNNALIYHVVRHYLVERKFRLVSYGLSSIQAISNEAGLEKFKKNMGFQSTPVHRAFVVSPLLRPFVNRLSWKLVRGVLKLWPRHPMLKMAEGALRMATQSYIR